MAAAGVTLAAEPVMSIPKMKAPVIDGVVGAEEWKGAGEYNRFCELKSANIFQRGGNVLVGRDDENLYVAVRTQSSPYGLTKSVPYAPRHQVKAFWDESIEFDFIVDVAAERTTLAHYVVNFNGAFRGLGRKDGASVSWYPDGVKNVSTERDGWWIYELAMPLKTIGFDLAPDKVHGLRVARNWHNCDQGFGHQTSLGEGDHAFEIPYGATRLVFDDESPVVQVRELGGDRGDQDANTYPVTVNVYNPGSKPLDVKVLIEGHPEHSQPGMLEEPATLAPGADRDFKVNGAVLGEEPVDLVTRVTSADGKKTYFFRHLVFKRNYKDYLWIKSAADLAKAKYNFAYYPSHNLVHATADVSSVKDRPQPTVLRWYLLNGTGAAVARTNTVAGADGKCEIFWNVPDLRPLTVASGCPDYTMVMSAEGIKDGTIRQPFKRYAMAWEGNRIGLSGVVPPPFKPILREEVRGKREEVVKVVLRDHVVDKETGLWKQVNAAGHDLLAGPMALESSTAVDSSRLLSSAEWDIDGLMTWTLTLKKGLKLDSLKLVIPMKAAEATLMHACVDGLRNNYAGYIPKGEGRVWDGTKAGGRTSIIGDYMPYVWVGGTLRGICVCGENDKGWEIGDLPCQEIVREADGTVKLIVNLVQKPVEIAEDRTIRLGIQATPVKPMQENWRGKDIGTLMGACLYFGGCGNGIEPFDETTEFWEKMAEARRTGKVDKAYLQDVFDRFIYAGEPGSKAREVCEERFRRHYGAGMNMSAGNKKTGRPFTFYTNARGIEFGCRAGTTYCDEWSRWEYDLPGHVFARHDKRDYDLDPVASYRDYAMWCYKEMIETGACNYIYWDDVYPSGNFDLVPGNDAYRRADGAIQQANGFFNMRELVRRTAIMQAECGFEHRFNWVHMTNTATAPICSFAGVNYDWEDGADLSTFQDRYGIDYILACSTGRQLGNIVSMMGYIGKTDPENQKRLYRCGTGVMLAFEFQWNRVPQWCELNKKLTAWGYRDAATKVWNFWDEDVAFPVTVKGGQNAALAMARRGEAIVIVSDFDKGGEFAIVPDAAAMGLKGGFRAYDFETGAEIPVENGTAKVTLKKHDFAIVGFR